MRGGRRSGKRSFTASGVRYFVFHFKGWYFEGTFRSYSIINVSDSATGNSRSRSGNLRPRGTYIMYKSNAISHLDLCSFPKPFRLNFPLTADQPPAPQPLSNLTLAPMPRFESTAHNPDLTLQLARTLCEFPSFSTCIPQM